MNFKILLVTFMFSAITARAQQQAPTSAAAGKVLAPGQKTTGAAPVGTKPNVPAKPAAPAKPTGPVIPVTPIGGANVPDLYDVPEVRPVSQRRYSLKNEITAQLSYLTADPFVKYIAGGLTYTRHFSDFMGWEVFNANYAVPFYAGLTTDLVNNFGQLSSSFDSVQYFATTNLTINPIYTKNLVFNSSTVYSQIEFVGGAGLASFKYAGIKPLFDAGIILRYFLSPSTSLKLDFRDYLFPSVYTSSNFTLIIGYAVNLGND